MNGSEPASPIPELERRLAAAQARLGRATAALAPKHRGGEWEEYRAAHDALLVAERAVAAAKGEEYAEPLDFPVRWCTGAPLPHLIANDHKTLLVFLVDRPDPNWDGSYVTLKSPADGATEPLALVEFARCASAKLGTPNDEVFSGHPLHGRGLDPYTAQVVRNSRWLAELERVNSVHAMYRPEAWRKLNHYVFWFHDTTFECAAESYKVEVFEEGFADVLARACRRLTS
jgi:hypothetical protein